MNGVSMVYMAADLSGAAALRLSRKEIRPRMRLGIKREPRHPGTVPIAPAVYSCEKTSPIGACIRRSAWESLGVGALLMTTSLSPLK